MTSTNKQKCEKRIKTAELKMLKILSKIDNFNLNNYYVSRLNVGCKNNKYLIFEVMCSALQKFKYYLMAVLFVVLLLYGFNFYKDISSKKCILELPSSSKTLFRPPEDCRMCYDVHDVVRLANISSQEFEDLYAYSATPVIVVDAAVGWRANEEFNFNFFANFYKNKRMGKQINDCFYFAYKSGLNSLQEVFDMDVERANLSGAPWYVGWSTCYEEETRNLRSYYSRPYFLPRTAESDMVDWIFMGGPGQGAHMHVDSVKHMSWQAQIRGRKQWQLAPPPECIYSCQSFSFTVLPGEILVVDTNRWYHKTDVLPGDISITIGAEYD